MCDCNKEVNIKVVNESKFILPKYEHDGSAGMDVYAELGKEYSSVIKPGERKLINTGLRVSIPKGYEIQIRPRSGLAWKHGITVLNSPGTIDSGYTGLIGIILINHGDENFTINHGDRIGQIILKDVKKIGWENVISLEETERGECGFGSTGV